MNLFNTKIFKQIKRRLSMSNSQNNEDDESSESSNSSIPQSEEQQINNNNDENQDNNININNDEENALILPLDDDHDDDHDDDDDDEEEQEEEEEEEEEDEDEEEKESDYDESTEQKEIFDGESKQNTNIGIYPSSSSQKGGIECLGSTSLSIETVTIPTIYNISWLIDSESLNFALLKNKNKNQENDDNSNIINNQLGVLDAVFIKNNKKFKLELCISGWKNSNRGYCAFYLTIPNQTNHANQINQTNQTNQTNQANQSLPPLIARYMVTIHNTSHNKQSSIRDDFHLGVGFPNFCSEELLIKSQKDNDGKLQLNVEIEIFKTESKVKQIENKLYKQFVDKFGASCSDINNGSNHIQNRLLLKMYKDKTFCDVEIKCKDKTGKKRIICVHKCILTHSSLVFQKMFNSSFDSNNFGFVESQENEINLQDSLWSYFIIKHMIKFLYFGEIDKEICKNIQYLFQLFQIAEYYQINALITECINQFILTLTPNTVCYLLLNLENKYEHVQQIQFIQNNNILWSYMIKNIKQIKKTSAYRQILHHSPLILNKLIDKMT